LARQLQAWCDRRNKLKMEETEKQLAETNVDLDPSMIKKFILKLQALEKELKELRKLKRGEKKPSRRSSLRGSQGTAEHPMKSKFKSMGPSPVPKESPSRLTP